MPNPRQQKISIETCLVGQVFFISSNAYKIDYVTKNIVLLGGRTELFFSKNVTSLLVDDYYVDQFKIHCQDFNGNGMPISNGKAIVPVGVSNCRSLISQEMMHLGPPAHFRPNVARVNGLPTREIAVGSTSLCMYSASPSKVGEYSKYSALTQHHTLEKPMDKFAICTPEQVLHPYTLTEAGELKKIAMLTATAGKSGELSTASPSCFQPSKCISLSTVHTFNHGLAVGPISSQDYSYRGAKEKSNKAMYNQAIFQLMHKAHQWGIAITGICQFMKTVEMYLSADFNKPKRRPRASNKIILSGCFLKVEDAARKYKAFYKVLKEDPIKYLPLQNRFISKQVEKYGSAIKFMTEVLNIIDALVQGRITVYIPSIDNKPRIRRNGRQDQMPKIMPKAKKKQNHFCECCNVYFSDFGHVFSEKHVAYANDERNYECIRDVIRTLPTMQEFLHKHCHGSSSVDAALPLALCNNAVEIEGVEKAVFNDVLHDEKTKFPVVENGVLDCSMPHISYAESKIPLIEKSIMDAPSKVIDFSVDKCLLAEDFAGLGTLTPNLEESEIKFEFDDCYMDASFCKDDDGFKDYCEQLLGDTAVNYLPEVCPPIAATFVQDVLPPVPSQPLNLSPPRQGLWKVEPSTSNASGICLNEGVQVVPDQLTNLDVSPPSHPLEMPCKSETVTSSNCNGIPLPEDLKVVVEQAEECMSVCPASKTPDMEQVVEIKKEPSEVIPDDGKQMFSSSESSDDEGKRNAFIGDVLTRIHSSENIHCVDDVVIKTNISEDVQCTDVSKKQIVDNPARVGVTVQGTSTLTAESSISKPRTGKLKKHSNKRVCKRKFPPLWSVSIVPSKTIRMRFTCLRNSRVSPKEHCNIETHCLSRNESVSL